jgi:hypothetical protein
MCDYKPTVFTSVNVVIAKNNISLSALDSEKVNIISFL